MLFYMQRKCVLFTVAWILGVTDMIHSIRRHQGSAVPWYLEDQESICQVACYHYLVPLSKTELGLALTEAHWRLSAYAH